MRLLIEILPTLLIHVGIIEWWAKHSCLFKELLLSYLYDIFYCFPKTGVCPVLCSGRGTYGGGRCHCDPGWAGPECDLPYTEFDLPFITCSIPCGIHGKCLNGRCQCDADYTGASCETRKFANLLYFLFLFFS